MDKQNPQSPAWGAPVSSSWGSPLSTSNVRPGPANNGNNSPNRSPNPYHTPIRPSRDSFPSQLNRSNSHPYRVPPTHGNNNSGSPLGGGNFNYNSPRLPFTPRPRYQSSPLHNNNGGMSTPRFNRRNSSQDFTPSPRHHSQQGSSRFVYNRDRRSFQRDQGMNNNPGGSNNINDYIHPSMLEDPWKDLKPQPLLRQY